MDKNIELKATASLVLLLFLFFIWLSTHQALWDKLIAFVFGAP